MQKRSLQIALGAVLIAIVGIVGFRFGGDPVLGAPDTIFQKNVNPLADSTYELGTSSQAWLRGTFDELCLTGDACNTLWPVGGAGAASSSIIQEDGVQINSGVPTLDLDGTDFTIVESPADDFDITIAAAIARDSELYTDTDVADYINASTTLVHEADTTLTQEEVEDFVGGMVTGNTETNITVTYQDADGTIDFEATGGGDGFSTTSADYWAQNDLKLQELSDVESTPQANEIMYWSGSAWVGAATSSATLNFVLHSDLHAAVTLAGQDYLTLSGQQITAGEIEPDDLANSDFGEFTCNGTTCTLDAESQALSEMSDVGAPVTNNILYWNGSTWLNGATTTDTNTTYTAGGTLLDLTGTAFSLNEGTLTDGKLCTYEVASGLVCNSTDAVGGGGSGAWATTTDSGVALTYVVDNTSDVAIGASATSTAEFFFDTSAETLTVGNSGNATQRVTIDNKVVVATTTATSSLPRLSVSTAIDIAGEYITNFTTYVRALFTGGTGITLTGGDITFDCSEVEGTGIDCTGEAITLDATGDWTGTLDTYQGSELLAIASSTMGVGNWANGKYLVASTTAADGLDWVTISGAFPGFTDIDTDYGNETVTSDWVFQGAASAGGKGNWDLTVGNGSNYGGLRIGDSGVYRSSYSSVNLDLGGAMVWWNEGGLDLANDPGIEFAIMEDSNTARILVPESGADNATAFIRSGTFAGPFTATIGNDAVSCDQWTTYDSNIDCDTSGTGADLFVQDDFENEGNIYNSGSIITEADDANQHIQATANQTASHTWTWPDDQIADTDMVIGNGAGTFTYAAMSGDVVMTNGGVTTIQASAVALATDVSGTLPHENGGLEADVSAYTGLLAISAGATSEVDTKAELENQIGSVDLCLASGDIYTGVHDFGGATSLELPNNGTVNANGEITTDDTSGQLRYYAGAAERVIHPVQSKCFTTASTTFNGYDDVPLWTLDDYGITVEAMSCHVRGGTSVVATLSDGTNALDSITCATTNTDDDGSIANATLTANEVLEVDFGTVTGTVNWINYCIDYSITAD